MSRVFLVLATLLAISSGASLDGQATRPIESELVDRIDSLSVVLRRAIDEADVADAVRKEERRGLLTARIDTFQVGPFSVVARKREVGLARRYFGRAWARYAATVGAKRTSLEGHVFIFGKGKALLGLDSQGSTRVSTVFMSRDRDYAFSRILGGVLAADLPDDLRTWVGEFFIRADRTRELERAYRSLLRTASAAVTDCYDGALDRCWDAMGLDHEDEWATAWYHPSERRLLAGRLARATNPPAEGILSGCLDDENDEACTALLVGHGVAGFIPLPPGARMTLVAHALSLGGPEGYTRLVTENEASIKDRLAEASGVSPDSLIGSWRAATLRARPDVHSDTKKSRWSTLIWFLVLAGISTRSTRWRLT